MGMTHGKPETFPRTADVMGFCRPEQVVDVAEKVVLVQRDFGDRSNRKHARLKYTIEERGIDWFRAEVERRLGYRTRGAAAVRVRAHRRPLRLGAGPRGQLALHPVRAERSRAGPAGRPDAHRARRDRQDARRRLPADREPEPDDRERPPAREAPDRAAAGRVRVWTTTHSGLRRNAMACVALPTCGLALAESERYLPDLVTALEEVTLRAGLRDDDIAIRMTGCPNGCARPFSPRSAWSGAGRVPTTSTSAPPSTAHVSTSCTARMSTTTRSSPRSRHSSSATPGSAGPASASATS